MDTPNHGTSPEKSSLHSTASEMSESQRNLERALRGLDQRGDAGLEEELDRIYPRTGHQVEDRDGLHSVKVMKPIASVPYSDPTKPSK